ncbi:MAG: antitoxin VbhA family protein [Oscillospiraceae bacterium]|nr:antitoxin VbhA family protein [Oscillospiraceae bacterium]
MKTTEQIIQNAEASLRMEGLYISEEARRECAQVLNGEMTHEQYVMNVRSRYGVDTGASNGKLQS